MIEYAPINTADTHRGTWGIRVLSRTAHPHKYSVRKKNSDGSDILFVVVAPLKVLIRRFYVAIKTVHEWMNNKSCIDVPDADSDYVAHYSYPQKVGFSKGAHNKNCRVKCHAIVDDYFEVFGKVGLAIIGLDFFLTVVFVFDDNSAGSYLVNQALFG
ncbi:hypothetical protein BpHYR1_030378 [Brachionus plicatilis]|uniref:Uncharacterized protein n=1 Tax=Brachionus plicatilis TaxID=10195 RepID=A0A3M7SHG1_BRAPC|nr:hypothetical protein BpHYR1_030378 [Brachionus plicatilis]